MLSEGEQGYDLDGYPEAKRQVLLNGLHSACSFGHIDLLKWLIIKNEDEKQRLNEDKQYLRERLDQADNHGNAPLHLTLLGNSGCSISCALLLIAQGANHYTQNRNGDTAIDLDKNFHLRVVVKKDIDEVQDLQRKKPFFTI